MRALVKIVSVGFIWGWLQASALLLALLFFASQSRQVYDFGLSWEIGLLAALLSSFVAGFVLSDLESVLKALLLSTFVAFAYSILVVSILAVPVSVSREQGYAEAVFFGFLAPIQFFIGLLMGALGSVFGGRFLPRIRRCGK